MSFLADELLKQWKEEKEKKEAELKELQRKEAEKKANRAKMETRQNGMVVESSPTHDTKRIIANEYVQFNPNTNKHEVVDNVQAADQIKTIRTINTTQETRYKETNWMGYVPVEYTLYDVITEPRGEVISFAVGGPFVKYWFIIEPEASSTSTSTSTAGGRRRHRKKRTKRRTRGKLRTKSRSKSRKKRRKSRRRKRTRKRRRKNKKKQVGGGEFSENIMDIIRGDDDIIKLKTKGYNQRCTNCRGATHVLIAKLRELGVCDRYIGWGEWSGHSVAIVKDGEEIRENIKIDLESPPDDIGNYYVFDGSFHQISKDIKTDEDILFTGKLIDYYKDHYSKSWREDTKLAILPLAREVHRNWIVVDDYGWMLD